MSSASAPSEGGEPGRCAIWMGGKTSIKFQKALLRVRPQESVEARWTLYALRLASFTGDVEQYFTGTTIKHFPQEAVLRFQFPVAPLAEQRRIVAKIETLLTRVNAARERLEKVPLLLKRFRQSVLAKAFRGELVPTECELAAREGCSFESASKLLGKPIDDIIHDLPDGWARAVTAELFTYVPSGSRNWSQYYADGGAFFIRITNLDHGSITLDLRDRKYVNLPSIAEGKRTRVQANDILVSITADVGMVALVPEGIGEAYVNQHIALARPTPSLDPKYLAWYFAAESGGQTQLRERQRGATKVGLALDDIGAVVVPVPPLAEQRRIVAKVEALLGLANSLEQVVERIQAELDRAPQAILQRAFAGELVPTEAELARTEGREFESAEELLRRVRAETNSESSANSEGSAPKRRGRPRNAEAVGT